MDKYLGCLLGLAVGDALGTAVECMPYGSFEEVTGMRDGGKYNLQSGQWTDDTSLALCMAESIIENTGTVDWKDIHQKYRRYYEDGHLTSIGQCFDIGKSTLQGMNRHKATGDIFSGGTEDFCSGNGSIMRLAPIPMLYALKDVNLGISQSADSSKLTHGGRYAVDCCKLQGLIIMLFLRGDLSKDELFSSLSKNISNYEIDLCQEVLDLLTTDYNSKIFPGDIVNSGFSLKALESALWAFYHTDSFSSGVLKVALVNMGDDSDTVAAIYGQIAGAYYGLESIPKEWVDEIAFKALLMAMGEDIYLLANDKSLETNNLHVYEIFHQMEEEYSKMNRKLNPGPSMYKSVEQYDNDCKMFENRFQEYSLLQNYKKLFSFNRKKVEQRAQRKPLFPFGN